MSEIKLSVLAISVALIVIGFIVKLAPVGKGQKAIKGVLSLIIVLIITAPLSAAVNIEPNINIEGIIDRKNDYSGLVETTTVNLLKSRIEQVLIDNGVNYCFVDITVINNGDSAEISAITVYTDSTENITKIKSAVRKELQLDIAVAVEKGR